MRIITRVLVGFVLVLSASVDCLGDTILATSNFNIPPFTAGITVDGQGGSEPGWAAPWLKLGGFEDRGHVVTSPTQEGNGAVQIFADMVFGTSVEREWSSSSPIVRVDAYVYATTGASMDGQIVTATPAAGEIDTRRAGAWRIDGSGSIRVFDETVNGFVLTGFQTLPDQWNKYSLIANTNTSTYSFLFNDDEFDSPHPLPFLNDASIVVGINMRALGTLTSYVDNVTVISVPEPSTYALGAVGAAFLFSVAVRRGRIRFRHAR
jgi:PEP-CTERM motif